MSSEPSSIEEAVELFLSLRQRGEYIGVDEFARRYESLGPELRSALASFLVLEHAASKPTNTIDESMPERIGPYRIVREIGRGGMGVVLEAQEEKLGRRVALKVLPAELLSSTSARARFKREAELAARLDHSGIATIYGAGVEADHPWIAMRYVEGETLARAIARARDEHKSSVRLTREDSIGRDGSQSREVLRAKDSSSGRASGSQRDGSNVREGASKIATAPRREALSGRESALAVAACLSKVARALHAAHTQGVLHRDVKPSNIIVGPDGAPVLLDFGLAIADDSEGRTLTRTGETAGTPAYIAPESVSGEIARPDGQSDVYALGVTLYECLTLRRPFDAPTPAALYRAILAGSPVAVRALNPSVPRDLAVIVATAMERDRARRYRSASALAEDLEACVAGRPIAARPVPMHGRVLRWIRREPRQALLAGLLSVATIAAAVSAGSWWQSRAEVRAAARLTNAEQYDEAIYKAYGNLAANWLDDADQGFTQALAIVPKSPEAIAGRAFIRLKRHQDADALDVLADAPRTAAFDSLRMLAAGKLPDVDLGAEWFARASAVEMFIDGTRLMKQLEKSPRSERKHLAEVALARFDEAVRRSRTSCMLYHLERALAAEKTEDEAAIRSAAAALVVLWPEHERALFTAGEALYRIDPAAAIPLLVRATELDPTWGGAYQVLGNAYYFTKDFDASERALRRALAFNPQDADAYNSLGIVLNEKHCTEDARQAYFTALTLRPMFETWANLGLMDADAGDPQAAELELRAALDSAPRDTVLRSALALVLSKEHATREALAEIETVLGLQPRDAASWCFYSRFATELGDAARSVRAAEIGLEIAPGDADLVKQLEVARQPLAAGR